MGERGAVQRGGKWNDPPDEVRKSRFRGGERGGEKESTLEMAVGMLACGRAVFVVVSAKNKDWNDSEGGLRYICIIF